MAEKTVEQAAVMNDPWVVADNARPRDFEYYGQVKADCWFGFFPGGGAKPIPFDHQVHPIDKRTVMIDIQIIPVPEQNVSFDIRQSYTDFSLDWTKVTLPSIKAIGVDGIRALNNQYVRVGLVNGKREKKDDNGNKNGEFYKTFKFLEVFPDAASCSAAYSGAAPQQSEPDPAADVDKDKATAFSFAKVVVENKSRGQKDVQKVVQEVTETIAGMPMINKYYTGESPDILALIQEAMK